MKKRFTITSIVITFLFIFSMQFLAPAQETEYKTTRWDELAKAVRFTVLQENQLKLMLQKERNAILEARSKASEQIMRILKDKQRTKWDALYRKADKQGGDIGDFNKRMLLNPEYLASNFTLKPAQKQILHYIYWDYARSVDKVRKKTRTEIEKLLMPEQMENWDEVLNYRRGQEAKKKEKSR